MYSWYKLIAIEVPYCKLLYFQIKKSIYMLSIFTFVLKEICCILKKCEYLFISILIQSSKTFLAFHVCPKQSHILRFTKVTIFRK